MYAIVIHPMYAQCILVGGCTHYKLVVTEGDLCLRSLLCSLEQSLPSYIINCAGTHKSKPVLTGYVQPTQSIPLFNDPRELNAVIPSHTTP